MLFIILKVKKLLIILGKVVSGWKVQNEDTWTLIGKRDPQKPQMFYPIKDTSLTLTEGDTVAARCTMVNTRDRITYIGSTNEDEMCNFYIMYWVEGNGPMKKNTCFTPVNINSTEKNMRSMTFIYLGSPNVVLGRLVPHGRWPQQYP